MGSGGTGASSGSSTTTSVTSSSSGESTSGTGGQPGTPAPPLVVTGQPTDGTIALYVDGSFRLEATDITHWQFERWFDLRTSEVANLAATSYRDMLLEPLEMNVGSWYGAEETDLVDVTLTDETPARATLENTLVYPPGGPFQVHNKYTVYASGRVGLSTVITNTSTTDETFDASEVSHTSVAESFAWSKSVVSEGKAIVFQRTDGATPFPAIISVAHDTDGPPYQDFDTNYYWSSGGATLAARATFAKAGEIQVGLGDEPLAVFAERSDDVLAPGIALIEGATGGDYDRGAAAYTLTAQALPLRFAVSNAQTRHAPAFVIDGFSAQSWTLRKNGVVLASSGQPDGPFALVHQDLSNSRLVVVSVESIRASASDEERTFVIDQP